MTGRTSLCVSNTKKKEREKKNIDIFIVSCYFIIRVCRSLAGNQTNSQRP